MALPTEIHPFAIAGGGNQYQVSNSLRFRSSATAYLTRTSGSAGNRKTFTWSGWVKRGSLGATQWLFDADNGSTDSTEFNFAINSGDALSIGGSLTTWRVTTQVFRDPSAWYHIVLAVDTTQATANNRIRLYVNGSEVTTFSTLNNPTQNLDLGVNQAIAHYIGIRTGLTSPLDGYLAEVNFIDGQALDSSYFGQSDSITGIWGPKKYTGTYGTNGFYLPFTDNSTSLTGNAFTYSEDFGNAAWSKYQGTVSTDATTAPNGTTTADKLIINNGNVNAQLYRTFTAADNTTYTLSVYAKVLDFSVLRLYIQKKDASYGYSDFDLSAGTVTANVNSATGAIVSVGSGWYRCSTSVNVGTGSTGTPTINIDIAGSGNGVKSSYFWGAQLETAGSVGPYFVTTSAATSSSYRIGSDNSTSTGGYNNWVTNNISLTSGTTYDSMIDSPTAYNDGGNNRGNYSTLNPLTNNSNITLSSGNLNWATSITSAGNYWSRASIAVSSGKWYWEVTPSDVGGGQNIQPGIQSVTTSAVGSGTGQDVGSGYAFIADGTKVTGTTVTSYGSAYVAGNVIGIALDMDNGAIYFSINNTWQNSGNPTSGSSKTGAAFTGISGSYTALISVASGGGTLRTTAGSMNFGQRPFSYTPPTGFLALNTYNLANPSLPLV